MLIRLEENEFLCHLLADLYKRNILSVMVEGGAQTLQNFIDAGYWDEARVFVSSHSFGTGIRAPGLKGNLIHDESVLTDTLHIYEPAHEEDQHS
jgi:diaminohydroxyphosphoribosylaminopyrimidine deaminase/5-amino-6-(5-phosphoribosylamino)uracil reductase